ncbi:MAG TPA: Gfo/Idh/MocA family oxidoreductase [Acidimicrobiales bacterium]|nr:Gfo/Idh/MocA family oxidoreductase [Acidimicrobiales bacterium]
MERRPTLLVVSSRPSAQRRQTLAALWPAAGVTFATPADEPDPSRYEGVVVDGPWPGASGWAARLAEAVRNGCRLVTIGPDPDGGWQGLAAPAEAGPPPAELFVKAAEGQPLLARLPSEFAVEDALTPLVPPAGATVLLSVSIGFRDRVAGAAWALDRGHVCALGLSADATLAPGAPVGRLVARAVRPPEELRPRRTLGVGVVGYGPYGGMGYYHGLACQATDGLELVAACDPDPNRRKAAEADFAGIRTYADLDDMAADADLDIAVVATPPTLHFATVRRLLEAGKHVACEKPLCMTVDEVDTLVRTAGGLCLTVNQNRRWDPDFVAIRRAVDAGLLGELFNVETFVGGFDHPCRAWHSDVAVSGGAVYDWGSHHVDWLLQLMGEAPARVTTYGHKRVWHDVTNLDQLRLHLLWEDGREGVFFQSDLAAVRKPKFFVQGTAGTLVGNYRPLVFERLETGLGYQSETAHHAEAPADLVLARYESGYGVTETRLPPAPPQPFAFHRNLADHLLLGEPLAVTVESVRPVIAVLEASQRSSDEGGSTIVLDA